MPPLNTKLAESNDPLRVLVYGPAKHKKTWWAGLAAEAGFNVVLFDGDDGTHILQQIKPEAQSRIDIIKATDNFAKPVMAQALIRMVKGDMFLWDEQKQRAILTQSGIDPENSYYSIDLKLATPNTVLIIDSWTAFVQSIAWEYAVEQGIDLSDASKTDWDGFGYAGRLADWVLTKLKALPCHVVIIAHMEVWEKRNSEGKVIDTRIQPSSTSRPHAQKLAKFFSDVLYFEMKGKTLYINAEAKPDRDGGARNLPPEKYKWDDLSFADFCKSAGIPCPDGSQPKDIKYFESGSEIDYSALKKGGGNKAIKAGTASTTAKVSSGLATKKPQSFNVK